MNRAWRVCFCLRAIVMVPSGGCTLSDVVVAPGESRARSVLRGPCIPLFCGRLAEHPCMICSLVCDIGSGSSAGALVSLIPCCLLAARFPNAAQVLVRRLCGESLMSAGHIEDAGPGAQLHWQLQVLYPNLSWSLAPHGPAFWSSSKADLT